MLSAAAATTLAAATFAVIPGAIPAGAGTANFKCNGINGDVAGNLSGANQSSKQLMDLIGSLGGSPTVSLPVAVDAAVPAALETGADPFNASFKYNVVLPADLVKTIKETLGKSSVKVKSANFSMNASGAGTGTATGTVTNTTIDLNAGAGFVATAKGEITPDGSGLISYKPGATRLAIDVNASVGPAKVGVLTLDCTSASTVATTSVKPAGAPNIANNPLERAADAGGTSTVNVMTDAGVTEDKGNPITPGSLRIVDQPSSGSASVSGDELTFNAPTVNGTYSVAYEVCADPLPTEAIPGVNEVQSFNFANKVYGNGAPLSRKPLFFTLKLDGQESAPIITATDIFGQPFNPAQAGNPEYVNSFGFFGNFVLPNAAKIQKALESLPNVAPGDVTVTGGAGLGLGLDNPYTITFGGNLAFTDVGQVEVGQFETWLPASLLQDIIGLAGGLGGGDEGGGGAPLPTFEQLTGQLARGEITWDQFVDKWGQIVQADLIAGIDVTAILGEVTQWFPANPVTETAVDGVVDVPAGDTGPLCNSGVVEFTVSNGTVEGISEVNPEGGGAGAGGTNGGGSGSNVLGSTQAAGGAAANAGTPNTTG